MVKTEGSVLLSAHVANASDMIADCDACNVPNVAPFNDTVKGRHCGLHSHEAPTQCICEADVESLPRLELSTRASHEAKAACHQAMTTINLSQAIGSDELTVIVCNRHEHGRDD